MNKKTVTFSKKTVLCNQRGYMPLLSKISINLLKTNNHGSRI